MLPGRFPPVIMLHHVSDDAALDGHKPYNISHGSFTRLLDVLEDGQFTTSGFEDMNIPVHKRVIITFDDCAKHLWDFAIPELQRRNMKAVFYMPTACLGGTNEWDMPFGKPRIPLMNEADIKLLSDMGMEIGSHAHNHVRLGDLHRSEVVQNLQQSKAILESITGKKIISIAYPFGSIPKDKDKILKETGYAYGLSIYSAFENRYCIRRFIYHDGDDAGRLKAKLSLQYKIMRAVNDKLLQLKSAAPKK